MCHRLGSCFLHLNCLFYKLATFSELALKIMRNVKLECNQLLDY